MRFTHADMDESVTDRELRARSEVAYDPEGVDRSVIRSMLSLSPEERLASLEANIDFILEARRGRHSGNTAHSG